MTKMRGHITRNTGFWCYCCSPWDCKTRSDEKREIEREIEEELADRARIGSAPGS